MDDLKNTLQEADPVYGLAVSPEVDNRSVYFAARGSGLYFSDDGSTWQFALDALKLQAPLAISCVALAPNFDEMPHVFAAGPGGVLRSLDGGKSWYVTMLPSPPPFITDLAVSPNYAQDGIIFASTLDDGIFRSSDRGAHWTAWNFGLFDMHVLCITVSPGFGADRNLFLGTESGIFRSVNGGLGWRELDFPVESAPVLSLAASPNFVEDHTLFAGTEESGLFSSQDRGKTWRLAESSNQIGSINTILLSLDFSKDPCIVVANGETILVSHDTGLTWKPWRADLKLDDHLLTVAAPEGVFPRAKLCLGLANGDILKV